MAQAKPNPIKDLQDELTCPICLDNFKDPVSIECGHNFCRACISRTWRGIHTQFSCPQCRKVSKWRFFRPNRLVENVVEITNRLLESKINNADKKTCQLHQEPLKLYCLEDQQKICLVCRESIFHKNHNVIPLEESTSEFKGNLKEKIQTLKMEFADLTQRKCEEQEKSQKLQDDVGHKRKMLACEFESLRQLLADNERVLNDRLEKMEKTIIQKRDETISKLDGKLSTLQKLIADLEKNRVPTVSQIPESKQDSNGAVMRPIEGAQFLEQTDLHRMMASRDYMKMFTVSVTFDQKTANFNLSVSGNRKLVRYEEYPKNVMPHPDRFDSKPCVLGLTGYKIGKRYWEVDVGGGIYWSVGVAKQSVCRKGVFKIQPRGGIWAIGLLGMFTDQYYAFTNPDILLNPRIHPVKIGVFLDCDEHFVAFYNADTMEHLHSFYFVQTTDKLYPFFCVGALGTELKLD
ncbi:E3 ubiquitin- ligase TRIM39-like [Pelobates cultripes]|uniref:E3 ubiquitin- ligase TRIM39-like n=1 Tax=Pelobates cultripes TaxID=61616 RepID=A0AAD1R6G8_PELCU|nr:E3 ubiquitin- ligase TRIM39-like [Pelobates cultripes]